MIAFYAFLVLLVVAVISVSTIIPAILCSQKVKVTWWDYSFPFAGVLLWFLLWELGFGGKVSQSNFMVEMFVTIFVSIAIPWIRFALTFIKAGGVAYLLLFLSFVPSLVAISTRLLMPLLPE